MNGRKLRVDPQLVFGLSLLGALAISWPGFSAAMRGSADIMLVGVRFLIAVAVVWTGLFCVASIIAGFASTVPEPEESDDTARSAGASAAGAISAPTSGDDQATSTDSLPEPYSSSVTS
jgi:hypothetical protein